MHALATVCEQECLAETNLQVVACDCRMMVIPSCDAHVSSCHGVAGVTVLHVTPRSRSPPGTPHRNHIAITPQSHHNHIKIKQQSHRNRIPITLASGDAARPRFLEQVICRVRAAQLAQLVVVHCHQLPKSGRVIVAERLAIAKCLADGKYGEYGEFSKYGRYGKRGEYGKYCGEYGEYGEYGEVW